MAGSALAMLCLLGAGTAAAAEEPTGRLAVVFSSSSLDGEAAASAEARLRGAVHRLGSMELLPAEATRRRLASSPGCSPHDLPCLVALGEEMAVSHLIVVTYEAPVIEAIRVDVQARAVVGNMTGKAPAGLSSGTASRLVRALLSPGSSGALSLAVEPPDARLFVDGERVDPGLIVGLATGQHDVTAELAGFKPASRTARVAPRQTTELNVRLAPGGTPSGVSPWLVGGASTASAGLLVAVAAGAVALSPALSGPALPGQEHARKSFIGSARVLSATLLGLAGLAVAGGVGAAAYSFMEQP